MPHSAALVALLRLISKGVAKAVLSGSGRRRSENARSDGRRGDQARTERRNQAHREVRPHYPLSSRNPLPQRDEYSAEVKFVHG